MRSSIAVALVSFAFLPACGDAPKPVPVPSGPSSAMAGGPMTSGAEVHFHVQEGWVEEPPENTMRMHQYRLPGEGGATDATLVVSHFGPGGGGPVEANLARWAGQLEQPDGGDPLAKMTRSARQVGILKVTEVALKGTYNGEMRPGGGSGQSYPGWSLMGAVIECSGGPYFVKLTGPEATVERWKASFTAFIDATDPGAHAER